MEIAINLVKKLLNKPLTRNICYILGAFYGLKKLLQILHAIWSNVLRPSRNLLQRYGPNSWAVITGSTAGIGKEFCKQFAERGFNVCMIGRNQAKLIQAEQELKRLNPLMQTRIIETDFAHADETDFFVNLFQKLEDLEISVLVNNAGVSLFQHFEDCTEEQLKEMTIVNVFPSLLLTHSIIKNMLLHRKQRSAVINVSSACGVYPIPYFSAYSASKAFVDFLTRALQVEYPNIDFISLRPYDVTTKQTWGRKEDLLTISTQKCVNGCLQNLGYDVFTFGHILHQVQGAIMAIIPDWLFNYIFTAFIAPSFFTEQANFQSSVNQTYNENQFSKTEYLSKSFQQQKQFYK